jgi:predicted  nucleic acid-binding Zn-ribbon protein
MMEGHEERAAEAEYELAEMEEQSDSLADDIEAAKDDWEQKKQDGSVPGAGAEQHAEGPDPEVTGGGPAGGGTPEVDD